MTQDERYLLDNQQAEAGRRFDALSELFDPVSFRHLAAIGVAPGWVCWAPDWQAPPPAGWRPRWPCAGRSSNRSLLVRGGSC